MFTGFTLLNIPIRELRALLAPDMTSARVAPMERSRLNRFFLALVPLLATWIAFPGRVTPSGRFCQIICCNNSSLDCVLLAVAGVLPAEVPVVAAPPGEFAPPAAAPPEGFAPPAGAPPGGLAPPAAVSSFLDFPCLVDCF